MSLFGNSRNPPFPNALLALKDTSALVASLASDVFDGRKTPTLAERKTIAGSALSQAQKWRAPNALSAFAFGVDRTTSLRIASLAGREESKPGSLTMAEIRELCGSLLSQSLGR